MRGKDGEVVGNFEKIGFDGASGPAFRTDGQVNREGQCVCDAFAQSSEALLLMDPEAEQIYGDDAVVIAFSRP